MKHLTALILFIFIVFSSCSNTGKIKMAMNKSFRAYIAKNDSIKGYQTKIDQVKIISYKELNDDKQGKENKIYEARILFVGLTSYEGSQKIYNINDTVLSYFDENLNMTHMVNPNNE